MDQGIFLSVDFSKAYDSVFHSYLEAVFRYIALPPTLTAVLMSMFRAPLLFAVGQGIVPDVPLDPGSGIKQGDPLSLAIFVMVCSVLVPMIQRISPDIHVLFYADDLLLYIPLPPAEVLPLLDKVFDIIKVYGYNVGLKINLDKSAFLLKGFWHDHTQARLQKFGVSVRTRVKYLGVLIGHLTAEEAYAPIMARAATRAHFMRTLPLTFSERIALFQEWILSMFIFPARTYFPTDTVVAQLATISRTALRISSWGLTLPILESPPGPGR